MTGAHIDVDERMSEGVMLLSDEIKAQRGAPSHLSHCCVAWRSPAFTRS